MLYFILFIALLFQYGFTFTQTTVGGMVEYIEPTTNSNGSPLNDLDRTEITTSLDGIESTPIIVPATSSQGGGHISQEVTVPLPSGGYEGLLTISVIACDNAGQRGANISDNCSSAIVLQKQIDTLSPNIIQ